MLAVQLQELTLYDLGGLVIPGDTDGPFLDEEAHGSLSIYQPWAEKLIASFVAGDTGALMKYLPLVPIVILFAPLVLRSVASKVQKAYNVYGISLNGLVKDASKAIRKLIPNLLSQFS